MSAAEPMSEHPVDALVRDHLRRQASTVDAAALLARVRAGQGEPGASATGADSLRSLTLPARPKRRWLRALLGLAAAAAALLAFVGGRVSGPVQARPEVILREARQAHALPVDRCYLVQFVPDPNGPLAGRPLFGQPRQTRLWTRGDRFWAESMRANERWAWGQDDQGNIWIASGGQDGHSFAPGEAPELLSLAADVCTLRVETLLDQVLAGYLLEHEKPDVGTATHRIHVRPRPGQTPWPVRGAVLDVDAETRVLRRLVLQRTTRDGRPLATVTFTLIETQTQDDLRYQLRGHLEDPSSPPTPLPLRWRILLAALRRAP
jgi:hypothetical protein